MQILRIEEYQRAEPLFASLDLHLVTGAVLHGQSAGTIYVDDASRPSAALMICGHRYLLAGDSGNSRFNHELNVLFTQQIYPAALKAGQVEYGLYLVDGWERAIEEEVLSGLEPIRFEREYHVFDRLQPPALPVLEDGMCFAEVDRALVENQSLGGIDDLREEMQSERASVEEFLDKSFGSVILAGPEIIAWCLSEYNLAERCEVGIATNGAYQRRGLASRLGTAFLVQAYARGYRSIGWHCWQHNRPSSATAQRIGFEKRREYPCYLAFFDRAANLAFHGDVHLRRGEYVESLDWTERALALGGAPDWAYLNAACAAARLEQVGPALDYLDEASRRGFRSRDFLQGLDDLAGLHDQPRWQALMLELEDSDDQH